MLVSWAAHGAGIRVPDLSARNGGMSEAATADPGDASAAYYNPAGMAGLAQGEAILGGYWWQPSIQHQGAGFSQRMDSGAFVPNAYAVADFGLERWGFGLAVNNPFGTSVDWGDDGDFRFLVTKARLSILNIAPAASFAISRNFSVGVSLNVCHGDADLNRRVSLAPPPFPEGRFSFTGGGLAVGATVGLRWEISPKHSVGVVYRSPFDLTLKGEADLGLPSGATVSSPMQTKLNLPQIVAVGYAFHPTRDWTLAVDLEWMNWEVVNEVRFQSPSPAFDGQTIPLDWQDSVSVRVGVERVFSTGWSARMGYAFWQNSVPDQTYSPLLPDSDTHSVTAGVGYSWKHLSLDLAYQFNLWASRQVSGSVNGAVVDGQWGAHSQVVMLGVRVQF